MIKSSHKPSYSKSMPSHGVRAVKHDSLAADPHTTLMMSLIHRDFGSELFGRRHLWPAVTDSPRSRQRPFSSVFVENRMTVHDF